MNRLRDEGKVRNIGVSNFSREQLMRAIEASDAPVLSDQVRYNAFHDRKETLEHCSENGVMLTAHTPLNHGRRLDSELLVRIAERYGKTPAQIALRWLVQQENVSAIPKASIREHQRENLDVFDFELGDDEMERIRAFDGGIVERVKSALRV